MAEVRRFRPGQGGHIAQAVAKAIGEPVRPITPGGSPDPSRTSEASPAPLTVTATSFTVSDEFLLPAPTEKPDREGDENPDPGAEE